VISTIFIKKKGGCVENILGLENVFYNSIQREDFKFPDQTGKKTSSVCWIKKEEKT